jgi:hypothetical protein
MDKTVYIFNGQDSIYIQWTRQYIYSMDKTVYIFNGQDSIYIQWTRQYIYSMDKTVYIFNGQDSIYIRWTRQYIYSMDVHYVLILLELSVSDYYRNVSCALNKISTVLLL